MCVLYIHSWMKIITSSNNQKIIKQRQSNIELLRNISMFMVLLLHSSFLAFGIPEANDIQGAPAIWGQDISTRLGNSCGHSQTEKTGLYGRGRNIGYITNSF